MTDERDGNKPTDADAPKKSLLGKVTPLQRPETSHLNVIANQVVDYIATNAVSLDVRRGMWHVPEYDRTYNCHSFGELVWAQIVSNQQYHKAHYRIFCQSQVSMARARKNHAVKQWLLADTVTPDQRQFGLNELDKFVRLISYDSAQESDIEYTKQAIRQLMWQVKRRLRALPTFWETMVVFVGPQGTGKSSAVNKFCNVLDLLYVPDCDFSIFTDKFRRRLLNTAYLVRLDEMEGARQADIQVVKRIITSDEVQARGMQTEDENVFVRNASFVGTSNLPLGDILRDPTGMRRFVEVQFRTERYTPKWGEAIRQVDYRAMWAYVETGLDEEAPMRDAASRVVCRDDIDEWFDHYMTHTGEATDRVVHLAAYQHYCSIMRTRLSVQAFARRLDFRIPSERVIRPGNRKTYKGYRLAPIDSLQKD